MLDEAINNIHAQRAGSNTPRVQSGSFLRSVLDAVRRDAGLPPNEAFAVSSPACLIRLPYVPCVSAFCLPDMSAAGVVARREHSAITRLECMQ